MTTKKNKEAKTKINTLGNFILLKEQLIKNERQVNSIIYSSERLLTRYLKDLLGVKQQEISKIKLLLKEEGLLIKDMHVREYNFKIEIFNEEMQRNIFIII